ncbi:MAG: outer membrane beta-barrel protein [Gammaproteobacteria bacterium]
MTLLKQTILIVILSCCAYASWAEESFYIGAAIGKGDLDVDSSSFPNETFVTDDISSDMFVSEISGGYRFDNNWTLDLGLETYASFDIIALGLGDVVSLQAIRVGGGYHFPSEGRLSAFVKGGVSFWDLEFEEGILFNPGPEEEASRNGNDLYVQIGAEVRIVGGFISRLTWDVADNDFGDSSAVKLWFGGRF